MKSSISTVPVTLKAKNDRSAALFGQILFNYFLMFSSLVAQMVKLLPAMQVTQVRSLGWEDPLEKEMATHSSIFCLQNPTDRGAWKATTMGVTRVRHDLATKPPPPE